MKAESIQRSILREFTVQRGFGPPTEAGYHLGLAMLRANGGYRRASQAIVARGLAEDCRPRNRLS